MTRLRIEFLMPLAAATLGACVIAAWLTGTEVGHVPLRVPRETIVMPPQDEGPPEAERNTGSTIPGEGTPSALGGSWPQFRGADRTNVVSDGIELARSWPQGGLRVLWSLEAGEGHAGAAIGNGCVYMMDYDRDLQEEVHEDVIRCLSFDDGAELWRYTYYVKVKRNHGMSRTVPAVTTDYVVSLGPKCHVVCLDARTGQRIWKKDLVRDHGTKVPPWYAGQCPLIDGDSVILAPGGDPLMMAVELATGDVLWQTPNPGGWGMTHSSVVPVDFQGLRQYVYCATGGVVGVSADDGRLLWKRTDWRITLANIPTPVVVGGGRVFLSGGYNSGCAMLELDSPTQTKMLWRLGPKVFGTDQQTPILYEDYIYGVIPSGELACLDLNGRRLWTSGAANRFGLGPYLLADGLLFVLSDQDGTLHMVEATPNGYNELAAARVLDGHDAWAPIAMADGRMILRDLTRVVCLELPQKGSP